MVCSFADNFKLAPHVIRSWPLGDLMIMQRYWTQQQRQRDEANAKDNPLKMQAMFGGN